MTTFDYYQCLNCKKCLPTFARIEEHAKHHDEYWHSDDGKSKYNRESMVSNQTKTVLRKGMTKDLPFFEKLTFTKCYTLVLKHQADNNYLHRIESPVRKQKPEELPPCTTSSFSPEDRDLRNHHNDSNLKSGRPPRKCFLKAKEKLRQVTEMLVDETSDETSKKIVDISLPQTNSESQGHPKRNQLAKTKLPAGELGVLGPTDYIISTNVKTTGNWARKVYYCLQCEKPVVRLANHRRFHDAQQKFPCIYCDKTFIKKANLGYHIGFRHCYELLASFKGSNVSVEKFKDAIDKVMKNVVRQALTNHRCPICQLQIRKRKKDATRCMQVHLTEKHTDWLGEKLKLESGIRKRSSSSQPSRSSSPALVKIKVEIEEEVHFTDKILLNPDGTAVHMKGEALDPDYVTLNFKQNIPTPASSSSSKQVYKRTPSATPKTVKAQRKPEAARNAVVGEKFQKPITPATVKQLVQNDPQLQKMREKYLTSLNINSGKRKMYAPRINGELLVFKCSMCSYCTNRAWILQLHMSKVHNTTILQEVSKSLSSMPMETGNPEIAPINDHDPVMLLCGTCAYPAKSADDLKLHMNKMHIPQFKCRKCKVSFDVKARLNRHIQEIHSEGLKYECKICKKEFTNKTRHAYHELKAHKSKKQCWICKRFYSSISINAHMRRHEERKKSRRARLTCMLCKDQFANSHCLRVHIGGVHLGKKRSVSSQREPTTQHFTEIDNKSQISPETII